MTGQEAIAEAYRMDRRGITGLGLRTYARPVLRALMSASFAGLVTCPSQCDEPQEHCCLPEKSGKLALVAPEYGLSHRIVAALRRRAHETRGPQT